METVIPRTGTADGCTSALRTAVSVPSIKTGWVAVASDLVASTSATGAGASAPQLLTRAEYLLMLTSDYCFTGEIALSICNPRLINTWIRWLF